MAAADISDAPCADRLCATRLYPGQCTRVVAAPAFEFGGPGLGKAARPQPTQHLEQNPRSRPHLAAMARVFRPPRNLESLGPDQQCPPKSRRSCTSATDIATSASAGCARRPYRGQPWHHSRLLPNQSLKWWFLMEECTGYDSHPTPSPSRSSLEEYPGSPRWTGAAPAALAAEQLAKYTLLDAATGGLTDAAATRSASAWAAAAA